MLKLFNGLLITFLLAGSGVVYAGACSCYGPTAENEHLYRIAGQVRPNASVSIQQTMLALLHANPSAFNQHNINGLKSGYRLHIPSLETIKAISPEAALAKVMHQNKIWQNDGRSKESQLTLAKSKSSEKRAASSHHPLSKKATKEKAKAKLKEKPIQQETITTPTVAKTSALELSQNQNQGTTNATAVIPAPVVKEVVLQSEQQKQFEQQTQAEIAGLQQKTNQMQNNINILAEDIRTLTYRFIQMNAEKSKKTMNYQSFLMDNLKKYGPVLGASLLGLLVLLYLLKQTFRKKTIKTAPKKNDYDYMGSQDSVPTKLNLARAYIDMGDDVAAKNALQEVLAHGNTQQKQEAQELLNKLNHGPN